MCALMFYIFDNTGFNIVMKIMTVQRVSIKWYCIYLQDHTLVGRPDAPGSQQDIQLSGLGIMPEHCIIDIEDYDVYITALEGARYILIQ